MAFRFPDKFYVLYDRSNSNDRNAYVWWFRSIADCGEHLKHVKETRRNGEYLAWLDGPFEVVRKGKVDQMSIFQDKIKQLELLELQGRQAGLAGESLDANPYTSEVVASSSNGNELRNAWHAGWVTGNRSLNSR